MIRFCVTVLVIGLLVKIGILAFKMSWGVAKGILLFLAMLAVGLMVAWFVMSNGLLPVILIALLCGVWAILKAFL